MNAIVASQNAGRHGDPHAVARQRVVEHHRRKRRGARDDAEQDLRQSEGVAGKLGAACQPPRSLYPGTARFHPPTSLRRRSPQERALAYTWNRTLCKGFSRSPRSLQAAARTWDDRAPWAVSREPARWSPEGPPGSARRSSSGCARTAPRVVFTGRSAERGRGVAGRTGALFVQADVTVAEDVERSVVGGRRGARRPRRPRAQRGRPARRLRWPRRRTRPGTRCSRRTSSRPTATRSPACRTCAQPAEERSWRSPPTPASGSRRRSARTRSRSAR